MKLTNRTGHKLGFAVGMAGAKEPTVTGTLNDDESYDIPDEEVLVVHNSNLKVV